MQPAVTCPKCGRTLSASGEVTVAGGARVPVYTCPHCVTRTSFAGETIEVPFMFLIGPDGRPADPADHAVDLDRPPFD